MNKLPTPETDALDCELHNPRVLQDRYSEMMEHAQNMERQRDEAKEELEILRSNKMSDPLLETTFKHLIRERDELKEALLIMENLLKPGIELFPEIGEILKQGAAK